jgi:Tat protein translocase TatB subunit
VFDIGMPEFLVISVVALIVLGPERLPEVMGKVGRAYRQLRQMSDQLMGEARAQWEAGMREVEEVSSTFENTWNEATSSQEASGPPPRLLQVRSQLAAPETAAGAGPWLLPSLHRPSSAEVESRIEEYPASPFVLERRLPADYDLAADPVRSIGGSSFMTPLPTPQEFAEWDALTEVLTSDLPLETDRGSRFIPAVPAGEAEPPTTPQTQMADPSSANGRYLKDLSGVPENGLVADAVRERTIIDLYLQGGISLDRAAGFLEVTPADFQGRVESVAQSRQLQPTP